MNQKIHKIQDFNSVDDFLNFHELDSPNSFEAIDEIFKKNCRSSYIKNGYGRLFFSLAYNYEFKNILELGVLDGYSLFSMASGLINKKVNQEKSSIVGVDLFDDYEFKNSKKDFVQNLVNKFGFKEIITLIQGNVFSNPAIEDILLNSNLVHVDLSNDRVKVENIMSILKNKKDFIIIFEGGSSSRDQVEWMIKYNKKPMRPYFENLSLMDKYFIYSIEDDPSLTIISSKGFTFKGN